MKKFLIGLIILSGKSNGFLLGYLEVISFIAIFLGIYVITSKNPIVAVVFLIGLFISISVYLLLIGNSFIGLSYLLVYVGAVSILFLFILMLINIRISELLNETNNNIALAIFTGVFFGYPLYLTLNMIHSIKDKEEEIMSVIKRLENYGKAKDNLNNSKENSSDESKYLNNSIENSSDESKDLNNSIEISSDNLNELHNTIADLRNLSSEELKGINAAIKNELFKENKFKSVSDHVITVDWENNVVKFNHIESIGNILYTNYSIWLIIASIILLLAMVGAIAITKKEKD